MRVYRFLDDQRGVALPVALVIILILTAIVLGVAQTTTSDLEIERLSRWDTTLQYLAQAGIEHQIYLLKDNKDAPAITDQNFPVLPGESPGFGAFWYYTRVSCTLNCSGNPPSRRWDIDAFGEIRRYDPAMGTWTKLQQRQVRAQVEIIYVSCNGQTNRCPSAVTLLRWEEVYP